MSLLANNSFFNINVVAQEEEEEEEHRKPYKKLCDQLLEIEDVNNLQSQIRGC